MFETTTETKRGVMTLRMTSLDADDGSFDIAFWQSQDPEMRFTAAWEMVEAAWEMKGLPPDELRLQRSAGRLVSLRG